MSRLSNSEEAKKILPFFADETGVLSLLLDTEGRIVFVNKDMEELTGYSLVEIKGTLFWEAVLAEDESSLFGLFFNSMERHELPYTYENYLQAKDGRLVSVIWTQSVISYEDHEYFLITGIDISEKKQEELKLIEQDKKIQNILEASPLGLIITDQESRVKKWNFAAENIFGWKEKEVLGKPNPALPMEQGSEHLILYEHAKQGSSIAGYETKGYTADGRSIDIDFSIAPLLDFEGKVQELVILVLDISPRKQAEEALKENERRLAEAYNLLDEKVNKAIEIHNRILPQTIPQPEGLSIDVHYQPAAKMGGDYYNFIELDNILIFYLTDVMGHGMDGAMINVFAKEAISSYINLNPDNPAPSQILDHLDNQYRQNNYPDDQLICAFMGVLDLESMVLTYSSAGFQIQPLVKLSDGTRDVLTCEGLFISNLVPKEVMVFEERQIQLTPKTTMLIATDGLAEQENGGEIFHDYYEDIFYEHSDLPPEVITCAINNHFCIFNNNSPVGSDDISYMVLQVDQEEDEKEGKYYFEIASDLKELETLYQQVSKVIQDFFEQDAFCDQNDFLACLHELMVNAIEHGNKFDKNKMVTLSLTLTHNYILAKVEDEGEGFNWCEKINKPVSLDDSSDRGRGVSLTCTLAGGNLYYNKKGNKAILLVR